MKLKYRKKLTKNTSAKNKIVYDFSSFGYERISGKNGYETYLKDSIYSISVKMVNEQIHVIHSVEKDIKDTYVDIDHLSTFLNNIIRNHIEYAKNSSNTRLFQKFSI